MKNAFNYLRKVLFLMVLGLFFSMSTQAQHSCATTHSNGGQKMSDYIHVNTFPHVNTNSYCLKVYVHNVMRSDLTGGVSESVLNTQVNQLNSQFSGTGISFVWDGNIMEINDDTVYDWDIIQGGTCPTINFGPLNSYAHSDGIDLFFYGRSIGGSVANGIADQAMAAFTPEHLSTATLAHELGHVLGLFHPYHGTIGYGASGANNSNCENGDGFSGHVAECPSGSNANFAGDYVGDTSAIDSDYICNTSTCTATAVNDNTTIPLGCGSSEFPNPDITNYMFPFTSSCNPLSCADGFTPLQVRRMKYFLEDPQNVIPPLEIQSSILTNCSVTTCGPTACGMVADFNANIDQCVVNFNGINTGQHCPEFEYRWFVDNVLVSTAEDFTYDFQSTGTYNVKFRIVNPTSPFKICQDTHEENITVSCMGPDPDPTCPPTSAQMFIAEVENCVDYQASFGGYPDIASINWYYRICGVNGGNEVFLGTTTGNAWNMHTVPIYLPPGNNYDNCILIVNAYPTLTDGTSCPKKTGTRLLSCSGNGGGGHQLTLSPNPTNRAFRILNQGDKAISEVKVTDMAGVLIRKMNTQLSREIMLNDQKEGIYFVLIKFEDGSSIVKKIIKE
ncbi:T9SS type A sorting domain-containing protein [Aureisphaera galaxeae]|uniref:T9SS type A sorting domain-containing protein n=1 Tax=Aureisphaera galaxeae TaxID=1538023 RepID=UPI002350147F|nr:T9SS type A sorting domain-containing protein [Aureisphaera galaxeae]MDC8002563.1 T9SS type A sorting domain-containing protein [Aureisphaera galaxeae]